MKTFKYVVIAFAILTSSDLFASGGRNLIEVVTDNNGLASYFLYFEYSSSSDCSEAAARFNKNSDFNTYYYCE
jgi:hypothetical protein